ncbi:hypothetical protein C0989_002078 [Termitomyces sp. Mn162]|nr:hypothetical protein C0989_002078 [Termitomyces sp. Mn162]
MPPRKRARQTALEDAPEPAPKSPLPLDANTKGVFDLPDEIWLEILSHFSSVRIPTLRLNDAPLLSSSTLEREHALRALTQTCRAFRAFLLPELWVRFEVLSASTGQQNPDDFDIAGAWYRDIAEALEKRSNGLRQSPYHANYVRIVSVALTRCKPATALDAFVRCLKVLPNLHTLQILRAHSQMTTHLKNAFGQHKIPQVRTIVLPDYAHNVLRACPEVRVVMCNCEEGSKLIGAIAKECKKVQVLRGFYPNVNMMKSMSMRFGYSGKIHCSLASYVGIVRGVPNLEEISMGCSDVKIIEMLSPLKHLRAIEICVVSQALSNKESGREYALEIIKCLTAAKKILLNKTNGKNENEKKQIWLRVRHHESRHGKATVKEVPLGL